MERSRNHSVLTLKCLGLIVVALALAPSLAEAGLFELSFGLSYNRSNYSGASYAWQRRWGAAIGYHFSQSSGVEFSYQNVTDRNYVVGSEDTTTLDQVYSISWVQDFMGDKSAFQPYVKLGLGQLNRDITGSYVGAAGVLPIRIDSVTVVISVGFKLFLLKSFAVRTEATSYLTGGSIASWQDNVAITTGLSYYF